MIISQRSNSNRQSAKSINGSIVVSVQFHYINNNHLSWKDQMLKQLTICVVTLSLLTVSDNTPQLVINPPSAQLASSQLTPSPEPAPHSQASTSAGSFSLLYASESQQGKRLFNIWLRQFLDLSFFQILSIVFTLKFIWLCFKFAIASLVFWITVGATVGLLVYLKEKIMGQGSQQEGNRNQLLANLLNQQRQQGQELAQRRPQQPQPQENR